MTMRKGIFYFFIVLGVCLAGGCAPELPQWEDDERYELAKKNEDTFTQMEANAYAYDLAGIAKRKMLEAFRYKLYHTQKQERHILMEEQNQWQNWFDKVDQRMTTGTINPYWCGNRNESRYFQRFKTLLATNEKYTVFKKLNGMEIKFNGETTRIQFGEIKSEDEYAARVNIDFCRADGDFIIAIVEPTNYGPVPSFSEKQQVNLCIWKGRKNSANYLIGNEIEIKSMTIDGCSVQIKFEDKSKHEHFKETNFRDRNEDSAVVVL